MKLIAAVLFDRLLIGSAGSPTGPRNSEPICPNPLASHSNAGASRRLCNLQRLGGSSHCLDRGIHRPTTAAASQSAKPRVAANRARIFVAVQALADDRHEILLYESRDGGATWRRPRNTSQSEEQSLQPSLFFHKRTLHAVWNETPMWQLLYRRAVLGRR